MSLLHEKAETFFSHIESIPAPQPVPPSFTLIKIAMSNQREIVFVNIYMSKISITIKLVNICMSLFSGKFPTTPPFGKLQPYAYAETLYF